MLRIGYSVPSIGSRPERSAVILPALSRDGSATLSPGNADVLVGTDEWKNFNRKERKERRENIFITALFFLSLRSLCSLWLNTTALLRLNHNKAVESLVDWRQFRLDIEALFEELGISEDRYYIKADLRKA
jgi:hypothetical protein